MGVLAREDGNVINSNLNNQKMAEKQQQLEARDFISKSLRYGFQQRNVYRNMMDKMKANGKYPSLHHTLYGVLYPTWKFFTKFFYKWDTTHKDIFRCTPRLTSISLIHHVVFMMDFLQIQEMQVLQKKRRMNIWMNLKLALVLEHRKLIISTYH